MDNYTPRLKEMYVNTIIPKLKNDLSIKNDLALPKLIKISLNMKNKFMTQLFYLFRTKRYLNLLKII